MLFIQILFVCLLTATSLAHPGHNVAEEAAERADYFKRNPKTLSKCASNLQARSSEDITRRHGLANSLRAGRGLATLQARDFTKYDYSHLVANPGPNVFAQNSSCILQPDVTAGPYLVTAESFRSNVVDGQQGVPLALEVRVMDTSTCEPVSGINLDLWHTNATGVYSGLQAGGNGNSGDATNLMNTAFRGIQKTNSNGVVQFETMFPGHYTNRANHIHVLTHNPTSGWLYEITSSDPKVAPTFEYHASHVGQLFFDQSLISEVEALEPYASNKQPLTLNKNDLYLNQEAASSDPFVSYTLIGDTIADGILAWMTIGIDTTEDVAVDAPYYLAPA